MSPFDLPPIVQEKIELSEIIEVLKTITNAHYMPASGLRDIRNSKPQYVRFAKPGHPNFPKDDGSGITSFYQFDEFYYDTVLIKPVPSQSIFKHICFRNIDVMINLTTLETIVSASADTNRKYYNWLPGPDYAIAIDNYICDLTTFD